jgi:hypothetical protein
MPKLSELKGTVYIAAARSLLNQVNPVVFLEAHEFYAKKKYAERVAEVNNQRPERTCKWHAIKIQFTAVIEES